MSFINLLIDKPRILFLTLSFILLAGISSAISIPIQENPELAQRWSGVRVFYPGASPERIETQIVNELEIKLREVEEIKELGKLPVVNFAAGGIATPADAALMMQLGCDGVFVGSGIFKSGDPAERAEAIVVATTNYNDPKVLADVSKDLGEPMVGINIDTLTEEEKLAKRGW